LLGLVTPLLLVASLSTLMLTNAPLSMPKRSWMNRVFATIRNFNKGDVEYGEAFTKRNQFGNGESNFTMLAIWLVALPNVILFVVWACTSVHESQGFDFMEAEVFDRTSLKRVSNLSAIVGVYALCFFLIPVTRHSVLLVAMNWSPVHALRFHIWAGHTSFLFVSLHGSLHLFRWTGVSKQVPLYKQVIPSRSCWTSEFSEGSACFNQIYNFTGLLAYLFFLVLWLTSAHWFRRKWYRIFYLFHVVLGPLMILCSIWHYEHIAIYVVPSILYYLASTSPTLLQALASRFRGGVKIQEVVVLANAGGCVEVRVTTDSHAQAVLSDHHPSKYVKICVPSISIVWHPFTVYSHPKDPTTLRILFRPVGPFTKEFRSQLASRHRPITLIDGFYRASDHCQEALRHDHVTIVTGGIGITPFISMIFTILLAVSTQLQGSDCPPTLQSITLIWSCREAGLIKFVRQQYLDEMAVRASSIPGFYFRVKIFCTDTREGIHPCVDCDQLEIGQSGRTLDMDSESSNGDLEVDTDSQFSGGFPDLKDTSSHNESLCVSESDQETEGDVLEGQLGKVAASGEQGHAMELGRMMPARHSKMIWNIPYFMVYTASVWLGFHFEFFPENWSRTTYQGMSRATWITMLVILFYVATAILIESTVLLLRDIWPAPRPENFYIVSSQVIMDSSKQSDNSNVVSQNGSIRAAGTISVTFGRPNPENILDEAKLASAPGIFVCGPAQLVKTVRTEAWKENSLFGLTRYCIYEEAFEM
jgi:predicted ferric reductase